MRARFSSIAAALLSTAALALIVPACDGGGGGETNPEADEDGDGYKAKDDCNDLDPAVHPGAAEPCSCDGEDDDCNGTIDDFACALVCYPVNDLDGDGFEPPADCNDQDASVNPGVEEPCECDAIDQDCSGDPQDFTCEKVCHQDKDNDGYDDSTDCDDENGGVNPGAAEACECDDVDSNCNKSLTDLPADCELTCTDADGDGVFAEGGDCDDGDNTVFPAAMEPCECDGVDQDCSGSPIDFECDLACLDTDGDGFPQGPDCDDNDESANPDGVEACDCDGVDNDCNGTIDDFDASCSATCTYLASGDACDPAMEPACGAGLACCPGGVPDMETCVTKCTGDNCAGNCPMVP